MGSGSTVLYSKLGYAAVWIDKALGWVWIAPNLKRTTAGCPCIRPTSQPPYMVPEAGRLRPEELLYTSNRRAQGCWFESHKRMFCFFINNLALMFVIHYICPFLVCCVRKAILMWQILIDWWLFWTFHFWKIGLVPIFKKNSGIGFSSPRRSRCLWRCFSCRGASDRSGAGRSRSWSGKSGGGPWAPRGCRPSRGNRGTAIRETKSG